MFVTQRFLNPAASHRGDHHAQRHNTRAYRVKYSFIFALRNHDHIHRVGRKAKAVTELLQSYGGADNLSGRRHPLHDCHDGERCFI